jgi:hypothetical protein
MQPNQTGQRCAQEFLSKLLTGEFRKMLARISILLAMIGTLAPWTANSSPVVCRSLFLQASSKVTAPVSSHAKLFSDYSYVSKVWRSIFVNHPVPRNGVVIEVAPGYHPKVGLGFEVGFEGTYYVVDPEASALAAVIGHYRSLFPRARIIPIQKTLTDALSELPKNPDALVANHPLDDMVVARAMDLKVGLKAFENVTKDDEASFAEIRQAWHTLYANPSRLRTEEAEIERKWEESIQYLRPRVVAIAQYDSYFFKSRSFDLADTSGQRVLSNLKRRFGTSNAADDVMLGSFGQNPKHWLIRAEDKSTVESRLRKEPEAVARLGAERFVQVPIRRVKIGDAKALYFDPALLRDFYDRDLSRQALGKVFATDFALDLEVGKPVELTGQVDRQGDPSNIGLSGNLGSGRAFYVGDVFNLKGIGRTPLATSKDPEHNSGRIRVTSSLWEANAANTVFYNLKTGASPVLGILDIHKTFNAGPLGQVPAATVVRLDRGSLDRPGHFLLPGKVLPMDLSDIAWNFGKQDGEKWIERIVHGAWSPGNIALDGRMLDFESVSSVVTRAPQFTVTGWYHTNLFGLEGQGQLKVIEMLATAQGKQEKFETLKETFAQSRSRQIRLRMLDLLGLDSISYSTLMSEKSLELTSLADRFEILAAKMFPKYDAMAPGSDGKAELAVFDFSRLFRFYPLARRTQNSATRRSLAMRLLKNPKPDLNPTHHEAVSKYTERYLEGSLVVKNQLELAQLYKEAESFIAALDVFYDGVMRTSAKTTVEIKAIKVNEDRPFLDIGKIKPKIEELQKEYLNGEIDADRVARVIESLVAANDRRFQAVDKEQVTDMQVGNEGVVRKVISSSGQWHWEVELFTEPNTQQAANGKLIIDADRGQFETTRTMDPSRILYQSRSFELPELASQGRARNVRTTKGPVILKPWDR